MDTNGAVIEVMNNNVEDNLYANIFFADVFEQKF